MGLVSRAEDRKDKPPEWHFYLLDEDTERMESKVDKIVSDTKQLKMYALGILVSITTTSIIMLLQRGG